MLFSSFLFLFGFLPLAILAVFLASRFFGARAASAVLLVASLIFYSWQTPVYFFLIGGSIVANFLLGARIARTRSKALFGVGVAFNLGLLGWFKYIGLFSQTLSDLVRADITIDGVVLPLAISFFTFQQIAYLADCLKAKHQTYDFLDYALFVAFFPQLIAGPIVHHADVTPQFKGRRFAKFYADDLASGVFLFAVGLTKKVLIADALAPLSDGAFGAVAAGYSIGLIEAWIGVLAYSFQIYFDFSGYSDMALGLALLFGITLPMNFNSPYKARSIVDFWRRWHITLSSFLRDYLYFPLGGNRKGALLRYRNLFIVMLLGGLWHGAAWTFVVWGGLHGAYLCVNHAWDKGPGKTVRLGAFLSTTLTFAAASLAWVFFRAESFDAAFMMLAGLFGATQALVPVFSEPAMFSLPVLAVASVIAFAAPNALELLERVRRPEREGALSGGAGEGRSLAVVARSVAATAGLGALCAVAVFVLMTSGPYEFIYFQF
ncbi:MAG: MBOAT family protein [Pseudomonadota bacterium]